MPKPQQAAGSGRSSKRTGLDNALAGQLGAYATDGYPCPAEPDTAEMLGAFEEDALDPEAAHESRFDLHDDRRTADTAELINTAKTKGKIQ